MRSVTPVLVAAHVALIAYACRELQAPTEPGPPAPAFAPGAVRAPAPASATDSVSLAELDGLERQVDSLMMRIREDERDVNAMAALAHLYLRRGAFERAIDPLARAAELAPGRDDLRYELRLAIELAGYTEQSVDLSARAREFAELAAMWGDGC